MVILGKYFKHISDEDANELNVWSKRKIQVKVLLSASGGMLVPCTDEKDYEKSSSKRELGVLCVCKG